MGNLINLNSMVLSYNSNLTGQIPVSFGQLVNLRSLELRQNKLQGELPAGLAGMKSLQTFLVNNNQLAGALPLDILRLPSLTWFLYSANQISVPSQIPLSERAALIAIYESTGGDNWSTKTGWLGAPGTECQWHGVGCEHGHVTSLTLPSNNLSGSFPTAIVDLPALKYLTLRSNVLTGGIPSALGQSTSLRGLYLSDNQFSGALPVTLGGNPPNFNVSQKWRLFKRPSPVFVPVSVRRLPY